MACQHHDFKVDWLSTNDGTRLAVQQVGKGPWVVLANGLGGSFLPWRHLWSHLADRYRVVSFDYRGTHSSSLPACPEAVTVYHHVDDLDAVLRSLGVERAVFVCWSMGVQVSFELYRRRPEVFAGICAIDGAPGRTFESVRSRLTTRLATDLVLGCLQRGSRPIGRAARVWARTRKVVKVLKTIGFVSAAADEEAFYDMVAAFAHLDFGTYGNMLPLLDVHDAWDVLPAVRVPTSIIVGEKDFMTPVAMARRMANSIAGSRLVVLPNCTHYAAVESPAALNEAVDELLVRCGQQWH